MAGASSQFAKLSSGDRIEVYVHLVGDELLKLKITRSPGIPLTFALLYGFVSEMDFGHAPPSGALASTSCCGRGRPGFPLSVTKTVQPVKAEAT